MFSALMAVTPETTRLRFLTKAVNARTAGAFINGLIAIRACKADAFSAFVIVDQVYAIPDLARVA